MSNTLRVGQKVWLLNNETSANTLKKDAIKITGISKVGREYFYLNGYACRFKISDLAEDTRRYNKILIFLSMEEVSDYIDKNELSKDLYNFFSHSFNIDQLSLSELKIIKNIIIRVQCA